MDRSNSKEGVGGRGRCGAPCAGAYPEYYYGINGGNHNNKNDRAGRKIVMYCMSRDIMIEVNLLSMFESYLGYLWGNHMGGRVGIGMYSEIKTWGQNYASLPPINNEGNVGSLLATYMALSPNPYPNLVADPPVWMFWGHVLTATSVFLGKFVDLDMVNSISRNSSILMWCITVLKRPRTLATKLHEG